MPTFNKKRKSGGTSNHYANNHHTDNDDQDGNANASDTATATTTATGSNSKRAKGTSGTAFKPSRQPQTDSDGNRYWEISKSRRVTVSEFKGKPLVNVREYYQKGEEWLPGKKGISMSVEQYSALVDIMPQIEETLAKMGNQVPRPDYSGKAGLVKPRNDKDDDDDDDDGAQKTKTKANFDSTSDEED
ncbi:hypothetical protein PV10_00398 [Exophiala mesophila]|uniref:Transcriptional coactivator p15 (PC4) C-terminal domain-containing protein n=1 Tax=Exophiala mesophila TaxID=212818 RepID=A0A0D2ACA6_EXOME|nr:uncharacterized protein PV10_00398 [Exophiala mesophila]KIV96548.1 hypothetical protein PV10_00398 [Exophiala mesophila]